MMAGSYVEAFLGLMNCERTYLGTYRGRDPLILPHHTVSFTALKSNTWSCSITTRLTLGIE